MDLLSDKAYAARADKKGLPIVYCFFQKNNSDGSERLVPKKGSKSSHNSFDGITPMSGVIWILPKDNRAFRESLAKTIIAKQVVFLAEVVDEHYAHPSVNDLNVLFPVAAGRILMKPDGTVTAEGRRAVLTLAKKHQEVYKTVVYPGEDAIFRLVICTAPITKKDHKNLKLEIRLVYDQCYTTSDRSLLARRAVVVEFEQAMPGILSLSPS